MTSRSSFRVRGGGAAWQTRLPAPSRGANDITDYKSEPKSRYEIWWAFGWPYETSAAMARLVFSGILKQLVFYEVLAHSRRHGAEFEGRMVPAWTSWQAPRTRI